MGRTDVLILGAGIAGTALAYHLARAGRSVRLVDPRTTAAGATGRAAGIVTEQVWSDWDVEVIRAAHAEARHLLEGSEPVAYWRNGFVRWTERPEWHAPLDAALERLSRAGANVRRIGPSELRALYPGARWGEAALGLYSPEDGCVTPSALASAYARGARDVGATLDLGSHAGLPRPAPGRGWSFERSGTEEVAETLVVAAGAWTKRLLTSLGRPLPLCPYRTQAALLRPVGPPGPTFPSSHDLDTDVYVRPESAGRILAGDGTESFEADPERFVPGGDPAFLAHLAESLARPFPNWGGGEVTSAWAGVCTATPDRRPLVGRLSGAPDLAVIAGFNGFGVMRAGEVARRLAALLAPGAPVDLGSVGLAEVRPDRFPGPIVPFPPRPGFTLEGGEDPRF